MKTAISLPCATFCVLSITAVVSGSAFRLFKDAGCNLGDYYKDIPLDGGWPSCVNYDFSDDQFPPDGNGDITGWWQAPVMDPTCSVYLRQPNTAGAPGCGNVAHEFADTKCVQVTVPVPFVASFCCGTGDCSAALANGGGRRDLKNLHAFRSASILGQRNDTLASRQTPPPTGNCAWSGSAASPHNGDTQTVSQPISCTAGTQSCSESNSYTVESSFSNTIGVDVSAEAGFFDIVSVTTTFSYSHTWEQSKSETQQYQYTLNPGTNGFVTWTPQLQCTTGSMSGSDCAAAGIPTGQQGTVCVPVTLQDGTASGIFNMVTVS